MTDRQNAERERERERDVAQTSQHANGRTDQGGGGGGGVNPFFGRMSHERERDCCKSGGVAAVVVDLGLEFYHPCDNNGLRGRIRIWAIVIWRRKEEAEGRGF